MDCREVFVLGRIFSMGSGPPVSLLSLIAADAESSHRCRNQIEVDAVVLTGAAAVHAGIDVGDILRCGLLRNTTLISSLQRSSMPTNSQSIAGDW